MYRGRRSRSGRLLRDASGPVARLPRQAFSGKYFDPCSVPSGGLPWHSPLCYRRRAGQEANWMEFELGQTYSGYKFLDIVRRSRHAVQYRVQNTLAQRVESLRALTGAAVDDPDATDRFLREVRIRDRLAHPHIVTFYTAVPIEGRMAMTTELPDSVWLTERLKLGPLPWREALDIARQLLEALHCIHQQSFVHCDITPDNILFGPGGFCKLAGFSLARPLDTGHVPESGAVVGNPRYISPEQVRGDSNLDHRSDLYSLGIVLYEMLCGRPPFESRSQFELMMAHVNQSPAPPSSVQPRIPQFLDAMVLRALAKDAADRYPSAAAFADSIAEIADRKSPRPEPPVAEAAATAAPMMVEDATAPSSATVPELAPVAATASAPEVVAPEAVTVTALEAVAELAPVVADSVEPEGTGPETVAVVARAVADSVAPEAATPEAATVVLPEAVAPVTAPEEVAELAPVVADATAPEVAAAVAPVSPPEAVPELAPVAADSVAAEATAAAPVAVAAAPEAVPELAPVAADSVAPEAVAPETVAVAAGPEAVPELAPVAADSVATEAVAPETVAVVAAPEAVPELAPVAADSVMTEAAAPQTVTVPELAPVVADSAAPEAT